MMHRTVFIALVVLAALVAGLTPSSSAWDSIFTSKNLTGSARGWNGFNNEVYNRQFGYLNVPLKAPMPADAHFPVASNTKLYVALSLYQLMEAGHIRSMDDNIAAYLDERDFAKFGFGNVTTYCPKVAGNSNCQVVTFAQLLDMSAGLADNDDQFLPYPGSLGLVVGRYILKDLLFIPGAKYYYSNPAFMLGSYFVEKFSGMTFNAYIQQNIITPAGMTSTYFDVYNGKFGLDPKRVDEYYQYIDPVTKELVATGKCSSEFDLGSAAGAGGIVSSQVDEMRLYYQLFNLTEGAMGKPFLKNPKNLIEIIRPRTYISSGFYYAQGLFVLAPNNTVKVPTVINYEGEIQCSHTSNVFDLTKSPPVMTQTWSNIDVFYATKTEVENIVKQGKGNQWQVFSKLGQQTSLTTMSHELLDAITKSTRK